MDKTLACRRLAHLITNFPRCRHQPQCTFERVAGYCMLHAVANDGGHLYGYRHCWCELQGQHAYPPWYDACDVIYYVIVVRARRMVCIFFLLYLGNRSKSDPCSYELFCLESHILSFPNVLQIPPESPCRTKHYHVCDILCVFCPLSELCFYVLRFWIVALELSALLQSQ